MPDVAPFDDVHDVLGDVLGVIADTLDGASDPDDVDRGGDGARVFHHVRDQLADDRLEFSVDIAVGLDDRLSQRHVETGEGVESLADQAEGGFGQVADADALAILMVDWLGDAAARARMGENGQRVVASNRGALGRLIALVESLEPTPAQPNPLRIGIP